MTKQRQKNNHWEQRLQYSNQQYTNTDEEPTWKRHQCKESDHHQSDGSRKEQGDQYHTNTDDESLFCDLDEYLEGKDMFMDHIEEEIINTNNNNHNNNHDYNTASLTGIIVPLPNQPNRRSSESTTSSIPDNVVSNSNVLDVTTYAKLGVVAGSTTAIISTSGSGFIIPSGTATAERRKRRTRMNTNTVLGNIKHCPGQRKTSPVTDAFDDVFEAQLNCYRNTAAAMIANKNTMQPKPTRNSLLIKRKKRAKDMPKRPLTAYNIFLQAERQNTKTHTTGTNSKKIKFEDFGRMMGMKWKALTKDDKWKYVKSADRDRDRYQKEMMEYREAKRHKEQEEDNKEIVVTTASIRKITDNNIEPSRTYTNSTGAISNITANTGTFASSSANSIYPGSSNSTSHGKIPRSTHLPDIAIAGSKNVNGIDLDGSSGGDLRFISSRQLVGMPQQQILRPLPVTYPNRQNTVTSSNSTSDKSSPMTQLLRRPLPVTNNDRQNSLATTANNTSTLHVPPSTTTAPVSTFENSRLDDQDNQELTGKSSPHSFSSLSGDDDDAKSVITIHDTESIDDATRSSNPIDIAVTNKSVGSWSIPTSRKSEQQENVLRRLQDHQHSEEYLPSSTPIGTNSLTTKNIEGTNVNNNQNNSPSSSCRPPSSSPKAQQREQLLRRFQHCQYSREYLQTNLGDDRQNQSTKNITGGSSSSCSNILSYGPIAVVPVSSAFEPKQLNNMHRKNYQVPIHHFPIPSLQPPPPQQQPQQQPQPVLIPAVMHTNDYLLQQNLTHTMYSPPQQQPYPRPFLLQSFPPQMLLPQQQQRQQPSYYNPLGLAPILPSMASCAVPGSLLSRIPNENKNNSNQNRETPTTHDITNTTMTTGEPTQQ